MPISNSPRRSSPPSLGLTVQACTATSRAIVESQRPRCLRRQTRCQSQSHQVGPTWALAVSAQQLESNLAHVKQAIKDGAQLAFGGERVTDGQFANGYFMQPTVLTNVKPNFRIACEEVFGPVVAVIPVDNFDEALSVANLDVGLSAFVVTRDIKKAMTYADRIQAGVKINQIPPALPSRPPSAASKNPAPTPSKNKAPAPSPAHAYGEAALVRECREALRKSTACGCSGRMTAPVSSASPSKGFIRRDWNGMDDEGVAIRAGHHCAQPLMECAGRTGDGAGELSQPLAIPPDIEALVRGCTRFSGYSHDDG